MPAPVNASVRPVVVALLMPPVMLRVAPESAPIAASKFIVMGPETVLLPETLCNWPPKLMPPKRTLFTPWRLMGLAKVRPPESWRAAPVALAAGETEIGPLPPAVALVSLTAPALMLSPPVQVPFAAARIKTPLSFLISLLVAAARVNAVSRVKNLPAVTSIPLFS